MNNEHIESAPGNTGDAIRDGAYSDMPPLGDFRPPQPSQCTTVHPETATVPKSTAAARATNPIVILGGVFIGTLCTSIVGSALNALGVGAYVPPDTLLLVWIAFTMMGIAAAAVVP